ncbi:P-loop NTPase [Candidatus Methanodesulfokora washburnensis]|jgi:ATP-binding protein involved in chromosome partitioning|uniref:ATP-binding protein n=1 Tax=Candidatus Methanodesulfokora washburnensis TaxID=2478471 RepID=A0A429GF63_9CREN|nr:P-loop NTPase [Candidatus Methanodesulfokores washburnensis]RSN72504.1 ATP-binding protein [Candidatus Methanodesulfokores washburnensis]
MINREIILKHLVPRDIGKLILIGSGKGGVGKSTVSIFLSLLTAEKGNKTGLLDLDVHSSSIASVFNIDGKIRAGKYGFEPLKRGNLEVMSLGFVLGDRPVPLRGEGESSVVSWLISMTNWGDLDYLIVDLPPGTGDEVLSAIRMSSGMRRGNIAVTTPSKISVDAVKKYVKLLKDENVDVDAVVINMSRLGDLKLFGNMEFGENAIELPFDPGVEEFFRGKREWSSLSKEFLLGIERIYEIAKS